LSKEDDFFDSLSNEEAIQFQVSAMQKTLKRFNYTETAFINDFIGSFQRLIKHLEDALGSVQIWEIMSSYPHETDVPLLMVHYYLSILDEEEGDYFEDLEDE
jgi:hypothetical protein